ncbi:MAG: ComF family protein [Ruminococcus sp.]|nr:ComF family protein [Ruminococcus sp.]
MDISLKRRLLHLLYPTRCPVCGEVIRPKEHFCGRCREELRPFTGEFPIEGAEGFAAAFEYDEKVSPAVFLLKNGVCGNAAFALGGALAERLRTTSAQNSHVIVPVPLHKEALRERGLDQSLLIAREVGRILGIPVAEAVEKTTETLPQKTLSKAERQVNLCGAFTVSRPEAFAGKRVLLVDDVCTTGSTLAELTQVLKDAGAAAVYCCACCKTPITEDRGENDDGTR